MIENFESVTVLVVEDEILIAMDLEAILLEQGLRVIGPCATLEDAHAAIQDASPDLAMLDFDLCGVSSLPLARELHRRDIPFAFLTGSSGNDAAAREFKNCAILHKPFDLKELIDTVKSLALKSANLD